MKLKISLQDDDENEQYENLATCATNYTAHNASMYGTSSYVQFLSENMAIRQSLVIFLYIEPWPTLRDRNNLVWPR